MLAYLIALQKRGKRLKLTRSKAIRLKCLDCCCGSANEVKLCTCDSCPLFPYRFGHNPKEEQELKAMEKIVEYYENNKSESQKEANKRNGERLKQQWQK